MKRYKSPTPRAAFAIAAIAMTTLTILLSIVVPATMESGAAHLASREQPTRVGLETIESSSRSLRSGSLTDTAIPSMSAHRVSVQVRARFGQIGRARTV
jgi:hypothetical protein